MKLVQAVQGEYGCVYFSVPETAQQPDFLSQLFRIPIAYLKATRFPFTCS